MKNLLAYAILATTVAAAPKHGHQHHHQVELDDEDCHMVWITVGGDESSTAPPASGPTGSGSTGSAEAAGEEKAAAKPEAAPSTVVSISSSSSATAPASTDSSETGTDESATTGSGTDSSSALELPKLPNGQPAIPLNDDYVHAPEDKTPVPSDAVTYTPKEAGVFDCNDFTNWMKNLRDSSSTPKFMKVKPGFYRYALGPKMPDGTDPNTVQGENINIYLMKGGWTLDLRGVTFYIDVNDENRQQRPSVMIYLIQSEEFTLIGGTVWIDQGELFTQATCTSVDSSGKATFQVQEGYSVSTWRTAGARNQDCIDVSNPDNYTFPGCNFWLTDSYDFSGLDTPDHTFTYNVQPNSLVKKGIVLTMEIGLNSMIAISTEDNGGLNVKGFTTNGNFMSIGLDGKVAPKFNAAYMVNPPPRPGFAPRVMGPAISWANVDYGFIYNPPGQPIAQFTDSYFEYTGNPKNLWDGADTNKPPGVA